MYLNLHAVRCPSFPRNPTPVSPGTEHAYRTSKMWACVMFPVRLRYVHTFQVDTRTLNDDLKREEARMLAQLRTGMARVNGYLCLIGASDSENCQCDNDRETVEHFLFECLQ